MVFPRIPKADEELSGITTVKEISLLINDRVKANESNFEQELYEFSVPDLIHVYNVCFKKKYITSKYPLHAMRDAVIPILKGQIFVAEPPSDDVFETLNSVDDVLNFFKVHCKRQCGIPNIKYDWDLFKPQDWNRLYSVLSGAPHSNGTTVSVIISSIIISLSKYLEKNGIIDTCPDWPGTCPSAPKGCAVSRKIQRDSRHPLWKAYLRRSECLICPKCEDYDGSNLISATCGICGEPSKCVQLKISTHCCKCTPSHDSAGGTGGTCVHCKSKDNTIRIQKEYYERKLKEAEMEMTYLPILPDTNAANTLTPIVTVVNLRHDDTNAASESEDKCIYCTWTKGLIDEEDLIGQPLEVWTNDLCTAYIPPFSLGTDKPFITVIPKEHYTGVTDIPGNVYFAVQAAAMDIYRILKDIYELEDLSIVQSTDFIAGRSIPHYAIHIIPRFSNVPPSITANANLAPEVSRELFMWFKMYNKGRTHQER